MSGATEANGVIELNGGLTDLVKPAIRAISAYDGGHGAAAIRLDANESPFDLPPEVKEELAAAVTTIPCNRYPDPGARELRSLLAEHAGVAPEQVMIGNGSDELIQIILSVFGGPGKRALIHPPTFPIYALAAAWSSTEPQAVPLGRGFSLPAAEIIAAMAGGRGVVFVCNPNNPTGNGYPEADIEEILAAGLSRGWVVLLDEAYAEFSGRPSAVRWLDRYPNLAVLRTLSKAFSVAGLRIGYLAAGAPLVRELWKAKLPYNVNVLTQAAAAAVLRRKELFLDRVRWLVGQRERLADALAGMDGISPHPSETNFVLFTVEGGRARSLYEGLVEAGISIRGFFGDPALRDCLRVTAGRAEENDLFLAKLADLAGRKG